MILVTVRADFSPADTEKAIEILAGVQANAMKMDGHDVHEVCTVPAAPGRVFIFQRWSSMEAFDAYRASDFFAQMGADLKSLMTAAPETIIYDAEQRA
jgi:quinol monooxygenase YgiN